MKSKGRFFLSGHDSEGDSRESWFYTLAAAWRAGIETMQTDANGPAWLDFAIWGNDPVTGQWKPLIVWEGAP